MDSYASSALTEPMMNVYLQFSWHFGNQGTERNQRGEGPSYQIMAFGSSTGIHLSTNGNPSHAHIGTDVLRAHN